MTRRDVLKERLSQVEELLAKLGAGEEIDIDKLAVYNTINDGDQLIEDTKKDVPVKDNHAELVAP